MWKVLVLLAVIAVVAVAWMRTRKPSAASLLRELERRTHDPKVAARLVEAERKRHPKLDDATLVRKAIRRLEADRRR